MLQSFIALMQTSRTRAALGWDDVRIFLALGRARTLGEAGRRLGVDASTMSRRLAALEEALGTTLFERGRGGILATEAATRLMPVAEEMEHVMARFTGEAEQFEREVAGRVRVACPADAAEVFLAPLLPELFRRHPRLTIDLEASEHLVDMTRRGADIALRTVRPEQGDLVVTRLLTVGWRVAASPERAADFGRVRAWSALPWITCTERFADTTTGRWYAAHVGEVEPVLRSDSLPVQIAAVAQGVGVALLPTRSLDHDGLAPVETTRGLRHATGPWPEDDLFLVTPRALRHVPRVRAVWDFFVDQGGR